MNPKAVASVARVSLNMLSMALLDFSCPLATDPFARGPFCFQHRVRQAYLEGQDNSVSRLITVIAGLFCYSVVFRF